MKPTLIIFAKAPRLGLVKTRLARDIGAVAAWSFHRNAVEHMVRRLSRDKRWRCLLAVTPGAAKWPPGVACFPQGEGDLGERMDRALRFPPPGPAVIAGLDIPHITPSHIAGAFKALGEHDAVFGPAEDGGYWLVGLKRRPMTPRIFQGVSWSTEHALADTLKNLPDGASTALLETLMDVDDGESYEKWRKSAS
ncbi:MAG TPA: glycosyltransferase [Rhodospirillales bacterium]|nr:glycosyltransferase [Rhodospirillales bacterium]